MSAGGWNFDEEHDYSHLPSTRHLGEILQRVMEESAVERMHPDECYLTTVLSRQTQCRRRDHPTPTSDCTTQGWIRHQSETKS